MLPSTQTRQSVWHGWCDSGSVRNESGGEPARPCGAHENQAVSTETCQTGIHPEAGKQDEKRGLGIPSVEDKLVQIMLKKLLEAIFEPDFENCSYGFRPNRNCTMAVKQLNGAVMTRPVNFIVEVDVRNFSTPSATIGCNVVWKNAYQTPTCCGWYANS